MNELLPCPYGDGSFPTVGVWLQHVAGHLTADAGSDSPAARLARTWAASPAARSSSGKSQEILMRLLAVALENRAVAAGAGTAAANARQMVLTRDPRLSAVENVAAQLQELAGDYESALSSSVADRTSLRQLVEDNDVAAEQAEGALGDRISTEIGRATAAEKALAALIATVELTPGPQGAPGQPRFVGDGPPIDPLPGAVSGDYYLDRASGDLYELGD